MVCWYIFNNWFSGGRGKSSDLECFQLPSVNAPPRPILSDRGDVTECRVGKRCVCSESLYEPAPTHHRVENSVTQKRCLSGHSFFKLVSF